MKSDQYDSQSYFKPISILATNEDIVMLSSSKFKLLNEPIILSITDSDDDDDDDNENENDNDDGSMNTSVSSSASMLMEASLKHDLSKYGDTQHVEEHDKNTLFVSSEDEEKEEEEIRKTANKSKNNQTPAFIVSNLKVGDEELQSMPNENTYDNNDMDIERDKNDQLELDTHFKGNIRIIEVNENGKLAVEKVLFAKSNKPPKKMEQNGLPISIDHEYFEIREKKRFGSTLFVSESQSESELSVEVNKIKSDKSDNYKNLNQSELKTTKDLTSSPAQLIELIDENNSTTTSFASSSSLYPTELSKSFFTRDTESQSLTNIQAQTQIQGPLTRSRSRFLQSQSQSQSSSQSEASSQSHSPLPLQSQSSSPSQSRSLSQSQSLSQPSSQSPSQSLLESRSPSQSQSDIEFNSTVFNTAESESNASSIKVDKRSERKRESIRSRKNLHIIGMRKNIVSSGEESDLNPNMDDTDYESDEYSSKKKKNLSDKNSTELLIFENKKSVELNNRNRKLRKISAEKLNKYTNKREFVRENIVNLEKFDIAFKGRDLFSLEEELSLLNNNKNGELKRKSGTTGQLNEETQFNESTPLSLEEINTANQPKSRKSKSRKSSDVIEKSISKRLERRKKVSDPNLEPKRMNLSRKSPRLRSMKKTKSEVISLDSDDEGSNENTIEQPPFKQQEISYKNTDSRDNDKVNIDQKKHKTDKVKLSDLLYYLDVKTNEKTKNVNSKNKNKVENLKTNSLFVPTDSEGDSEGERRLLSKPQSRSQSQSIDSEIETSREEVHRPDEKKEEIHSQSQSQSQSIDSPIEMSGGEVYEPDESDVIESSLQSVGNMNENLTNLENTRLTGNSSAEKSITKEDFLKDSTKSSKNYNPHKISKKVSSSANLQKVLNFLSFGSPGPKTFGIRESGKNDNQINSKKISVDVNISEESDSDYPLDSSGNIEKSDEEEKIEEESNGYHDSDSVQHSEDSIGRDEGAKTIESRKSFRRHDRENSTESIEEEYAQPEMKTKEKLFNLIQEQGTRFQDKARENYDKENSRDSTRLPDGYNYTNNKGNIVKSTSTHNVKFDQNNKKKEIEQAKKSSIMVDKSLQDKLDKTLKKRRNTAVTIQDIKHPLFARQKQYDEGNQGKNNISPNTPKTKDSKRLSKKNRASKVKTNFKSRRNSVYKKFRHNSVEKRRMGRRRRTKQSSD